MTYKKEQLPGNSDSAAALTIAEIACPTVDPDSEAVERLYAARMAEAGVTEESGFLLRSLTRRACVMETQWLQLMRDAGGRLPADRRAALIRAANSLNAELNKTLGLILRVRLAQAEDFAPFLTGPEQKQLTEEQGHGLTLSALAQAEDTADRIFVDEFSTTSENGHLPSSGPTLNDAPVRVGKLTLDPATAHATCLGQQIAIGQTEFRLLHFFMTHPGQVFNRRQLLDQVWGDQPLAEIRNVDVTAHRLRQTLAACDCAAYLQTVTGEGYCFEAGGEVHESETALAQGVV